MTQAQMTVADPDSLYQSFDKNLYRITGEDDSVLQMMQANPEVDNSSNVQVSASDFGSGVDTSTTIQTTGSMQAGKKTYDNTVSGYILGVDPSVGIAKFYIGNTTSYLNWTGSTLVVKGSISASSIDIPDTATTSSFHVDSSGNTWWGATTLGASTASVTAGGVATFAGLSSLNIKAYTDFETAGRFISSAGGSGSNTFGNQGVTVAPGATGTSYARLIWWITQYLFNNNPTFTCSMLCLGGFEASDGRAFIGLGLPTVDGTGIFTLSKSYAGFRFQKNSGVTTVIASNNNGDGSNTTETSLLTVGNNDTLEMLLHFTGTSILYYYRKNNGALTLGATHTTRIPTASENYVSFMSSNSTAANDFQLQLQCAAYEH